MVRRGPGDSASQGYRFPIEVEAPQGGVTQATTYLLYLNQNQ
jgi:hypothetical protein